MSTGQVDRALARRVSWRMVSRHVAVAALLALALGACGGKSKKEATTPGSTGTDDTELMGDGAVALDGTGSEAAADRPTPGKDAAEADPEDPDASGPGETPGPLAIEPPDLDVGAAAQHEQVARHLQAARAALRGPRRDPDQAISEARAALAVDATNLDAVVLIAHAYHAKRLYDTAEVMLDMTLRARRQAKDHPGVYYVYGLIYDQTSRPEQAMVAYQRAVELKPDHTSALINLGVHYLRNNNFREAVSLYERLTRELRVRDAATVTNLGSAYRGHSGDYPPGSGRNLELLRLAETTYKRVLSTDRGHANVYYNLGILYLDAGTFPGPDGAPMDKLKQLEHAKTYLDEYRAMSGADLELVGRRLRHVDRLITRETNRRKRLEKQKTASDDDDW